MQNNFWSYPFFFTTQTESSFTETGLDQKNSVQTCFRYLKGGTEPICATANTIFPFCLTHLAGYSPPQKKKKKKTLAGYVFFFFFTYIIY